MKYVIMYNSMHIHTIKGCTCMYTLFECDRTKYLCSMVIAHVCLGVKTKQVSLCSRYTQMNMDDAAIEKALSSHELWSRQRRWSAWPWMLITGTFVLSFLAFVLAAAALHRSWHGSDHVGMQTALSGPDNEGQIGSNHDPENLFPDQVCQRLVT